MDTFDTFQARAWADHGADPAAVAERLGEGLALAATDADLASLAHLGQHVWGEHLARWDRGLSFLASISTHAAAGDAARGAVRRAEATLSLAASRADLRPTLSPSDAVRVSAVAAAAVAPREPARATELLQEAVAGAAQLADADPAVRTVAANANNLAAALEEQPSRDDAGRALMIAAAIAARTTWERAGTWLEVARAEMRLAKTWLAAGEPATARVHADAALASVEAHGAGPADRLFAAEGVALAAAAAGDHEARARAVGLAEAAFAALPEDDRAWCAPTLAALPRGS
ncbi:MAG: hypothetical protein ABMA64_29295 [Myxococcota bacterium]